jgi:hypothetical protein
MKKFAVVASVLLVVLLTVSMALFRPRTGTGGTGTTKFQLSGAAGTTFTGYYVKDGRRVPVSDVLPWSFAGAGVTEFEFRKIHPEQKLTFTANYNEATDDHATVYNELPAGVLGIRGQVQNHGLSATSFNQ